MMAEINHKFYYAEPQKTDKDFLGWIYARLNRVFGERPSFDYMQRLEKIIDSMSETKLPEYVQGYKDGYAALTSLPSEVVFCGYKLDQLYAMVHKYEMDKVEPEQEVIEKPMTKLQAIDKVSAAVGFKFGTDEERVHSEALVQALEAIGLIKFDEPEKVRPWSHSKKEPEKGKYIFFPHPDGDKADVGVLLMDVIMTLTKYGYHVIPSK